MDKNEKLIVIGASGLLGSHIAKYYVKKGVEVIATSQNHDLVETSPNLTILKLDILDSNAVKDVLTRYKPHVLIHCAGITNVDYCEDNQDQAYKVNSYSVRPFSAYAKKNQAKFVYISTDHLFDGEQALRTEETLPSPLNIYAKSKLLGEQISLEECPETLIIRTNFFGKGLAWRHSFTDWLWSHLKEKKKLTLFKDSFFSPIAIPHLIFLMNELIQKNAHKVFNVCGSERISKYDFGIKFSDYFDLDLSNIEPGFIEFAPLKAQRPRDMSLSTQKLCEFLNLETPNIQRSFEVLSTDYKRER